MFKHDDKIHSDSEDEDDGEVLLNGKGVVSELEDMSYLVIRYMIKLKMGM